MFKEDIAQHEGQFERGVCPKCGHLNSAPKETDGNDEVWICENYWQVNAPYGKKRYCLLSWRVEKANV